MKQNTRDNIIQAAKYLFQTQGYNKTGISQIIKESGAPKGSLYYHFPNGKEEIAIAAIDSVRLSVKAEIEHMLTSYDDPVEALTAQFNYVASTVLNRNHIDFRIGLLASESASASEGIREACKRAYQEWIAIISNYLIEKGYSKEQAEQNANLINILIEGAITMSVTYQDISYFKLLAERIQDILNKT